MQKFVRMLLAQDGAGGGEPATEPKEPQTTAPATATAPAEGTPTEVEKLKAEVEKLKKEKADKEKAEQEAKLAAMSEDERKKAEQDALRKQLVEENRKIQLQKVGLDDEFAELVTGETAEEISKRGELIQKLVTKVKAETEATVKKGLARTPVPGEGATTQTTDAKTFYESILKK